MIPHRFVACALASFGLAMIGGGARAACDVAGARIEEAIVAKPSLREEANSQTVRDLRTLRDAAVILDGYKHEEDCRRLLVIAKGLLADPAMAIEASGDTDEDKAERIAQSRKPKGPKKGPEKATDAPARPAVAAPKP